MTQLSICEMTDHLMWFWGIMYFIAIIAMVMAETMTFTKFGFLSASVFAIQLILIFIKGLVR